MQVPRLAEKENACGFTNIGAQHCSKPVWFGMRSQSDPSEGSLYMSPDSPGVKGAFCFTFIGAPHCSEPVWFRMCSQSEPI